MNMNVQANSDGFIESLLNGLDKAMEKVQELVEGSVDGINDEGKDAPLEKKLEKIPGSPNPLEPRELHRFIDAVDINTLGQFEEELKRTLDSTRLLTPLNLKELQEVLDAHHCLTDKIPSQSCFENESYLNLQLGLKNLFLDSVQQ